MMKKKYWTKLSCHKISIMEQKYFTWGNTEELV